MTCLDERGRGRDSHGELWNGYYTQSYISEELASRWASTWIPDLPALSFVRTGTEFHDRFWIPAFIWDFFVQIAVAEKKKKNTNNSAFSFVNKSQIAMRVKVCWFIFLWISLQLSQGSEILEWNIAESRAVSFMVLCSAQIISPLVNEAGFLRWRLWFIWRRGWIKI